MRHADEGRINAYLDRQGEYGDAEARKDLARHIADCAKCSALLIEARKTRSEADSILADSEPAGIRPPSFQDVVRRAQALRDTPSPEAATPTAAAPAEPIGRSSEPDPPPVVPPSEPDVRVRGPVDPVEVETKAVDHRDEEAPAAAVDPDHADAHDESETTETVEQADRPPVVESVPFEIVKTRSAHLDPEIAALMSGVDHTPARIEEQSTAPQETEAAETNTAEERLADVPTPAEEWSLDEAPSDVVEASDAFGPEEPELTSEDPVIAPAMRVPASPVATGGGPGRMRVLALAATVVLAVSVGVFTVPMLRSGADQAVAPVADRATAEETLAAETESRVTRERSADQPIELADADPRALDVQLPAEPPAAVVPSPETERAAATEGLAQTALASRADREEVTAARRLAASAAAPAGAPLARLRGRVVHAESDQPVVGANVAAPDAGLLATTDSSGRFELDGVPAGQIALRVQALGFATDTSDVTVTAGEASDVTFRLEPVTIALDELVVTGANRQREAAESDDETVRRFGGTVALVEGLDVVSMRLDGDDRIVVEQRLAGDGILRLTQTRTSGEARRQQEATPTEIDVSGNGPTTATVVLGALRIAAEGPVNADEMRVLLGRLTLSSNPN